MVIGEGDNRSFRAKLLSFFMSASLLRSLVLKSSFGAEPVSLCAYMRSKVASNNKLNWSVRLELFVSS